MLMQGAMALPAGECVEPVLGPKLEQLYAEQDRHGLRESYDARHLRDYKQYASLAPIPSRVLQKGRHRQVAGHDNCTSCHFCRQCTEDAKPRCSSCGKSFCGPCLANRFGQNAHAMRELASWSCPVCLDFCNCSGSNCRRAQLGLEATASLIHEAQAFGYSSVRCVPCTINMQAQRCKPLVKTRAAQLALFCSRPAAVLMICSVSAVSMLTTTVPLALQRAPQVRAGGRVSARYCSFP